MTFNPPDEPKRDFPGNTKKLEEEFTLVIVDGLAEFADDVLQDDEVRHAPIPRDEGARLGPD